ncbi:MAG TPA: hypothetical protein VMG11_12060 [Steroidobacteraceae bacterium]|nr:hypothetical protein [Steroidobacteraceae bacterium]
MTPDEMRLLRTARVVLERYMWEGETLRDDVAEICMKLDDLLLVPSPIVQATSAQAKPAVEQAA